MVRDTQRPQWIPRLLVEYDNFRVALEWSRTDATGERELQLVGALARSDPSRRTAARARVLFALLQVAGMQTNLAQAGA